MSSMGLAPGAGAPGASRTALCGCGCGWGWVWVWPWVPTSGRRDVVARVGHAQVGEDAEEVTVEVGEGAVLDDRDRPVGGERRVDQREGRTGDRPQLDGDHVVGHPPPVGEAGQV